MPLNVRMSAAVPARFHNHIRFVRCDLAISFVGDLGITQQDTGLKLGRLHIEDVIIDWLCPLCSCRCNETDAEFTERPSSPQNRSGSRIARRSDECRRET